MVPIIFTPPLADLIRGSIKFTVYLHSGLASMVKYSCKGVIVYEYSEDYDPQSLHGLSQRKADCPARMGGYDAKRLYPIPVLDAEQHYIGCVSEGDFLRHILDTGSLDKMDMENHRVRELVRRDFCPPISIDADEGEVVRAALNQNFVPIVDSRNTLCGILTRRGVIAHLAEKNGIPSKV